MISTQLPDQTALPPSHDGTSSEAAGNAETTEDQAILQLPGEESDIVVCKSTLVRAAPFFAPMADEQGTAHWGKDEWGQAVAGLSPGARAALPRLLSALGDKSLAGPQEWGEDILSAHGAVQCFAVANLLGASELVEFLKEWSAECPQHLVHAILQCDSKAEEPSLQLAVRQGLDARSTTKLLHATAHADASIATEIIVGEEDTLGDMAASTDDIQGLFSPVDLRDGDGRTALHLSAVHNAPAVARTLLEGSASIDALCDPPEEDDAAEEYSMHLACGLQDKDHSSRCVKPLGMRTALHLAAMHDSAEVVQLLLERRASVSACVRNVAGAVTPLHECAAGDAATSARILAAAAAAAAEQSTSWSALDSDAPPAVEAAGDGDGDDGQKPSTDNKVATTTDLAAAVASQAQAADEGSDSQVQWSRFLDPLQAKVGTLGVTPLHKAAEEDAPGVVEALLSAKADPELVDDHGDTPLHHAVLYAGPRALSALVTAGVNISVANGAGELPLHLIGEFGLGCADSEESTMANTLIERHFARSFKVQKLLVEALKAKGELATALAWKNDDGNTPLHSVVRHCHLGARRAAELLVAEGASLSERNGDGKTPLEIALRRHGATSEMVTTLRKLGATDNPEDDRVRVPKHRPLLPETDPTQSQRESQLQSQGGATTKFEE